MFVCAIPFVYDSNLDMFWLDIKYEVKIPTTKLWLYAEAYPPS